MKNIEAISIVVVLCLSLFALVSVAAAQHRAAKYVQRLVANGAKCTKHKQSSGPAHTRKTYWICDGKKIYWWGNNFYKDWGELKGTISNE